MGPILQMQCGCHLLLLLHALDGPPASIVAAVELRNLAVFVAVDLRSGDGRHRDNKGIR